MRRNPNLSSWDGPSVLAYLDPCRDCDGSGICEDGERVDVDDYRDTLCSRCDGSGVDPGPEPDWAERQRLRRKLGRPIVAGARDPLLDLRAVRERRYADYPHGMMRYGEVRQRAVSPIDGELP